MALSSVPAIRFSDGFAEGFSTAVPEMYSAALQNQSFAKGDVIYQTPGSYGGAAWRDILRSNEWFVQVRETMSGGETVLFDLYHRTPDQKAFIPACHSLHWTDFVDLLRTGSLQNLAPKHSVAMSRTLRKDAHGQPPSAVNLKYRMGREMDELLGLCKGIIADGVVLDKEAVYLHQWLQRNPDIAAMWPARELATRLSRILWDGTVTEEEAGDLKLFLEQTTGETSEKQEILTKSNPQANPSTNLPLDFPVPDIAFRERSFCFTGRFLSGSRNWCWKEVERLGGTPTNNPATCHYLVIGCLGSRDWAHSSHGRKIESAVAKRQSSREWPKIVAEQHWASFLH